MRTKSIQSLEKLSSSLVQQGKKEEALECYERLYTRFSNAPFLKRLHWVLSASELLIWLDRFKEAEDLLDGVEKELATDDADIPLKARLRLLEKKGACYLHQKKLEQAGIYFLNGLKLAVENPSTKLEEIQFLNHLAQIELVKGYPEEALHQFKSTRKMASQLNPKDQEEIVNNDLGFACFWMRDFESAILFLEEDIKAFSNLARKEPLARALFMLAQSFQRIQKPTEAISACQQCIQICKTENLPLLLLRACNCLGSIHLAKQEYDLALENYERALEISVCLNDFSAQAGILVNQGLIYRRQSSGRQAAGCFLQAKQILENSDRVFAYENDLLDKCNMEIENLSKEERERSDG